MNKKLVLYFAVFLFVSSSVLGADILSTVLRPFSGINVGSTYMRFHSIIDAAVYLMIFLGLARMIYSKVYKGADGKPSKEANIIALGIGLALTFGMVVLESRTGFNLGQLYPVAGIVLLIVLAILLFNLIKGMFDNNVKPAESSIISFCVTYLVIYGLLVSAFSGINRWLIQFSPLLSALLVLLSVICFIVLLIKIFGLFSGDDKKTAAQRTDWR